MSLCDFICCGLQIIFLALHYPVFFKRKKPGYRKRAVIWLSHSKVYCKSVSFLCWLSFLRLWGLFRSFASGSHWGLRMNRSPARTVEPFPGSEPHPVGVAGNPRSKRRAPSSTKRCWAEWAQLGEGFTSLGHVLVLDSPGYSSSQMFFSHDLTFACLTASRRERME